MKLVLKLWHPPCRALAVLAQVHRASGFARAKPCGSADTLGAIADLTKACIGAGGLSEDAEGTWVAEATDMLLDTWSQLLFEYAAGSARSVPAAHSMSYM